MLNGEDKNYERRVGLAIMDAILKASMDPESKSSVVLTGETIQACLTVVALLAASSKMADSQAKTNEMCDDIAERLRAQIAVFQKEQAKGTLDFLTVISRGSVQ
jgi:hypothetical protein